MADRTTPVTDFLLDRPDGAKLAAMVTTAVDRDIKFTLAVWEKDLIDEAMLAVDQVPVEFVQMNPNAYFMQRRVDLRDLVAASWS